MSSRGAWLGSAVCHAAACAAAVGWGLWAAPAVRPGLPPVALAFLPDRAAASLPAVLAAALPAPLPAETPPAPAAVATAPPPAERPAPKLVPVMLAPAVPSRRRMASAAAKPQRRPLVIAPALVPRRGVPGAIAPPAADPGWANAPPDYPRSARRQGAQGPVWLRLLVGADGSVRAVTLARGSGHPALDQAAIAAARHWHFLPARQDGRKVAASLTYRVVFRLTEGED